jgi:lincosamide nucleotidyltransferase A/C/D/E
MSMTEARDILNALGHAGADVCLSGGWAVDALLGEQTRSHSDLDLWAPADDLHDVLRVMVEMDVDRVHPWPGDRPWNWVLHDGANRRVDLHLYEPMPNGELHYGSAVAGDTFPAEALGGSGALDGLTVRCENPAWALRFHTRYEPREIDRHDMRLLCERFGMQLPQNLR